MALNLGTASASLSLDTGSFLSNARQAEQAMDKLGNSGGGMFDKAGKSVESFSGKVQRLGPQIQVAGAALVAFGAVVTGAFGVAIKTSINFNSAMANVNSIAQLTTGEIADLSDQVLKLASSTGQGPQTLAEGLYDIYSSGFQGAEGLKVLEVAANAANAGLTTTAVSAKAVTAVLNAYGLEASDAGRVSDILFQTVNDGVLTFEQLATNMGNTLPLGNALGVTIEELAAAYAQMTLNGISATQAETQISALMRAAINPTEALTAAVNAYGYESASALIEAEGMPGLLKLLGDASGGSSDALFDLLGTSEAVNAALVLGKNNAADYTAELERMTGSSEGVGATQKALAKQMESTGFQLKRLKANLQVLLITIGTFFEPAIRAVASGVEKIIGAFLGLPEGVQKSIAILTAVIGAVALVGGAMLLVLPQIMQFRTAMAALGGLKGIAGLLGGGFGGLIPIIAGVALAAGLLYGAWKLNLFGIQDFIGGIVDKYNELRDSTSDVMAFVNDVGGISGKTAKGLSKFAAVLGTLDFGFQSLIDSKAPGWLKSVARFGLIATNTFRTFGSFVGDVVDRFQDLRRGTAEVMARINELGGIGGQGMGIIAAGVETIAYALERLGLDNVAAGFRSMAAAAGDVFTAFTTGNFQQALTGALDLLGDIGGLLFDGAVSLASWTLNVAAPTLVGWITTAASSMWEFIKNAAGWVGGVAGDIGAWTLEVGAPTVFGWISNVASNVWSFLKIAGGWVGNVAGDIGAWTLEVGAPTVFGWIRNVASNVWSWLKIAAGWTGNVIGNIGAWTLEVGVPTVFGWIKNIASNVWAWLQIAGGWTSDLKAKIENWTLEVLEPTVVDFIGDIGTSLNDTINSEYDAYVAAGVAPQLGPVPVTITGVDPTMEPGAFEQGMSDLEQPDAESLYEAGYKWGFVPVQKFFDGVDKAISDAADFFSGGDAGAGSAGVNKLLEKLGGIGLLIVGAIDGQISSASTGTTDAIGRLGTEIIGPALENLFGEDAPIWSGLKLMLVQPFIDIAAEITDGVEDLIQPILNIPEKLAGLGESISGALDGITAPFETAWDGAIAAYRRFREIVFGEKSSNTDEGTYANAGGTQPAGPGIASDSPAFKQGGANMGGMQVTSLPKTGSGPQATKVPALDLSAFDASVAAFTAKLQGILTAVNAVFTVAIPANITAGMTTSTAAITANSAIWGTTFGIGTQAILTLVNAVFVTAIPMNVNLGMVAATTSVSTNMATMGVTFGTGLQAMLTTAAAVFGVAIPASVQAGMAASSAATAAGMARMNASISSGMANASGKIRSGAGSWPGIISGISLYGAGVSIMTSLGSGIIAGFAAVRNTLLAITAEIPTLKGPPEKDARLLYDNGVLIMEGLERGMVDRFDGVKGTLGSMSDEIEKTFSRSSRDRVQRPGGGRGGGHDGGTGTTPPTGGTTEAKWSDAIAKGLRVATSDALTKSGLGTDTTVGSLFNEADWLARLKQRGEAMATDISDLFVGRTWVNSTDALINDGKFLEHYGSPVGPNDDITNRPPVIDPTRPPGVIVTPGTPGFGQVRPRGQLPNRPNNGGRNRVQQNVTNNYTTTDARTTQQLASPELIRVMDGASRGRTAYSSLSNTGRNRTLASGQRTNLGRV